MLRVALWLMLLTGLALLGASVWLSLPQPAQAAVEVQALPQMVAGDAPQAPTAVEYLNVVALPVQDSRLSNADSLGSLVEAIKVQRWNAASQSFTTRIVGSSGSNFALLEGNAYLFVTAGPGVTTMSIYGEVSNPVFTLARGVSPACKLNLIMLPPSKASLSFADDLAADIGGVQKVQRWNAGTQSFTTRVVGSSGSNFAVRYGYPYFVCLDDSASNTYWP